MRKRLAIAGVVWLICVFQAMAADAPADLAISLNAETDTVYHGEPLMITVRVVNVSSKPVVVPVDWSSGRFTMKHAHAGGPPREGNPFANPSDGMDRTVTLQPGQAHRAVTDILFVTNGDKPGLHRLEARLQSDGWYRSLDRASGQMVKRPCWAGSIESKPLSLTIKALDNPADREALAVLTQGRDLESVWLYSDAVLAGTDKRYATVLEKYPESVFARHCDMALARAHARSFDDESGIRFDEEAVHHYTNVIRNYPAFAFMDDAMLELARVYLRKEQIDPNKGYRDKAASLLEDILKKHSGSDSVDQATTLLKVAASATLPDRPPEASQAPAPKNP
jgi:hypothetical protein